MKEAGQDLTESRTAKAISTKGNEAKSNKMESEEGQEERREVKDVKDDEEKMPRDTKTKESKAKEQRSHEVSSNQDKDYNLRDEDGAEMDKLTKQPKQLPESNRKSEKRMHYSTSVPLEADRVKSGEEYLKKSDIVQSGEGYLKKLKSKSDPESDDEFQTSKETADDGSEGPINRRGNYGNSLRFKSDEKMSVQRDNESSANESLERQGRKSQENRMSRKITSSWEGWMDDTKSKSRLRSNERGEGNA